MIKTEGVVEIPNCGLYVKSPESLEALFKELKEAGYDIKDCSDSERRPPREVTEKEGWYLWYASLRDDVCVSKGKCNFCGSYIDVKGIQSHKHKCEVCGAYTYLAFVDGSTIIFYFMEDARGRQTFTSDIKMKIFDYDDVLGCLLLYPKPLDGNRYHVLNSDEAQKVLDANRKQFRRLPARLSKSARKYIRSLKASGKLKEAEEFKARKENRRYGKSLVAIPYDPCSYYVGVINTVDLYGHVTNHRLVKLFNGKEYLDWERLPVPDSYSIYEAWHWAPLGPSVELHEKIIHAAGMVSRCDYYYQDGRTAFDETPLRRMRLFVEHFTSIPLQMWDQLIRRAPKSGPGMIKTLAAFCQGVDVKDAKYRNDPNMWHIVEGLAKAFSGESITEGEKTAMVDALQDPKESNLFFDAINRNR